jgi:hypothetical protein
MDPQHGLKGTKIVKILKHFLLVKVKLLEHERKHIHSLFYCYWTYNPT